MNAPAAHRPAIDSEAYLELAASAARPFFRGRVDKVTGVIVEAVGIPAAVGELVRIGRSDGQAAVQAEVIGFRGQKTLLMPHGELLGISPSMPVTSLHSQFEVGVGAPLLGRTLNGFGDPLDGKPAGAGLTQRLVRGSAPLPSERAAITTPLETGVRVIDGLNTLGCGQRLGIFAGSGVGKSTLLGAIARGTVADVIVVALVGERGREVQFFADEVLGEGNRRKSVMVVATSDRPPIERFLAPFVAVTVAEEFRDQGRNVLLVMDSVTRFAAAAREIGLAAGEPPTVRGYPPSFFAVVPTLVERMGRTHKGSITGLMTVLLEGDDSNDPVADTLRGLLDGHLFLSRELAQRGHFPAVDVLASLSRLMPALAKPPQLEGAARVRGLLAAWQEGRDLVEIGAYKSGSNPRLDEALRLLPAIDAFLRQSPHESTSYAQSCDLLAKIVAAGGAR